MSGQEANRQVVERYIDAFNRGDSDGLRAVFAPDAVIHGVLGRGGLDVAIPIWRDLHAAFAIQLTAESIIAERELVAVRYTERGTFRAPFRGNAPTGNSYELIAMEWFLVKGGRICERWGARDSAAQARQIGLPLA